MELYQHPHAAVPGQVEFKSVGLPNDPDEEFDPEFQDFIESVSLTDEEFAVFLAMPESSVLEVKRLFRKTAVSRRTRAPAMKPT